MTSHRHARALCVLTAIVAAVAATDRPRAQSGPARDEWDVQQARGNTRTIEFTTSEGTWMNVDVSPDGGTLVFDLLGHIYRMPAAGGAASVLTGDTGVALNFQPAFSPDGKRIAFISDRAGQNNLWVMAADGSNAKVIEQNLKVRHSLPAWTPDGRFIVARRTALGEERRGNELWIYHADGGKGVGLTKQNEHAGANEPALSADGRFLFFSIDVAGVEDPAKGNTQLRRLDLAYGDVLRLTEGSERGPGGDARLSSGGGFAPRPSPDGKWLAFGRRLASGTISFKGRQLGPRTALWLRNLEDGSERLLVDPIERDQQERVSEWTGYIPRYAWSSDSRTIFIGQGGGLKRVDVASGAVQPIPFTAPVKRTISQMAYKAVKIADKDDLSVKFLRWPAVSPDGKRVIFQAIGRLWIQDVGSGSPRRLLPDSFASHQYSPAWSPDGARVAFTSWNDTDRGHVWVVPANGGEPQRLSTQAGEYLNPAWAPDGQSLVVAVGSGATSRGQMLAENAWYSLRLIPAAGGPARQLIDVNPPSGRLSHRRHVVQPSFGPDGRVYYPEMLAPPGTTDFRTEVRSIRTDGLDRRTHVVLPATDEAVVSPDGRWLAFEEGDNVFLAALPLYGMAGRPLELKREDKAVWQLKPVSTEGGNFPRFSGPNRLTFGSGNRIFVHDLASQQTQSHEISLRVPRDTAAGTVVLRNARLITMADAGVIPRGDIVVTDGRITAIGASGRARVPSGARVIDLQGKTVMPGLVDMHTHNHRSPAGILPQRDYEMAAVLSHGVTTSLDNSMWSQNIFPQAEMVDAGEIVGPRVYSTGDPLYAGDQSRHNELKSLEDARRETKRLMSYGAVSLKQYQQPERRQRQWVSEAARELGVMVTAEGGDFLYILSMVMDGQTGWEHPIPQVPLYRDVTEFLGKAGTYYSPTLVVAGPGPWNDQYWTQESDLWTDAKLRRFAPWRKLEAHTRHRETRPATDYTFPILAQGVADIIAAGGHAAIGAHGQQHGIASHWEVWMLASAMPPLDALRIATLGGARMLGAQDDIGSLAEGKLADLIVLNANPLDNIRNTTSIAFVMKGGRLYNGDTLDEVWPRQRPYGKFFWEMNEARPTDVKVVP